MAGDVTSERHGRPDRPGIASRRSDRRPRRRGWAQSGVVTELSRAPDHTKFIDKRLV